MVLSSDFHLFSPDLAEKLADNLAGKGITPLFVFRWGALPRND